MPANTSADDMSIGRLGRDYGEPQPQHRQRISNKPRHVLRTHLEKDDDIVHVKSLSESSLLYGLYQFSRPYTILGTILGITSVSTLALNSWTQVSPFFLLEVFKAIVPTLFMNIFVVGLNQIYDVEIDKVNKPYLPLASGVISMKLGVGVVVISLIMSLALGMISGSPALMVALLCFFLLGSVYSLELPFMRWKRDPFLAAATIVIARALVVQFAYFIHIQMYVLGEPLVFSRGVIFAACFMFLFASVISLFKDIPDVEGDEMHGCKSFSVMLGQERVFWMCINILMAAYGGAMATGVSSSYLSNIIVTVLGHFSLASLLLYRALQINISTAGSLHGFYMFIWKLFYAEYFLIPFMH
ncbi:probable homogentisate phytyltransferase 1, chloroplastic isoform X2 [Primulina eburnea]|uniref:probable homogentisate phytyltransferase 1, chloroplastic isoform X2 n=1 Tax=Primulina eburnea TaxID=1245227 RepID=UPI003C6BF323